MRALDHYDYHSPFAPVISFELAMAEPGKDGKPVGDIAAPFIPIEDALGAGDAAQAVRRFVRSLPAQHQDIIVRSFWNGESQAQIARSRGVSGAAISKSISRILRRGRHALSPYQDACLPLQAA
ncbi:MAG: sigma-70 family RNA polymerase sigma factor [Acidisphaera sp.]|nr:sigma-70 family RNA polymerase sigma factor [Acidisphaera sp.]